MWRVLRFVPYGCLVALLAIILGMTGGAGFGNSKRGEYKNVDYAYAVLLPDSLIYETSDPPNPNHGFEITLGASSTIWMDGTYSEDPTLNEAAESVSKRWEKRHCKNRKPETAELDGASAVEIIFDCDKTKESSPRLVTMIIALASTPEGDLVEYTLGMQSPSDPEPSKHAEDIFKIVKKGFRFLRAPK